MNPLETGAAGTPPQSPAANNPTTQSEVDSVNISTTAGGAHAAPKERMRVAAALDAAGYRLIPIDPGTMSPHVYPDLYGLDHPTATWPAHGFAWADIGVLCGPCPPA